LAADLSLGDAMALSLGVSSGRRRLVAICWSGRHQRAADGAGMAAEFGDHHVTCGDADIIESRAAALRHFSRGSDELVAELARTNEGDAALGSHRALVVRIAGKGEGGIRKREDEAAM